MVNDPLALGMLLGLLVALLTGVAEWFHQRRIARVAHLAFGPSGRPRGWTRLSPAVTTVAGGALTFGLVVLAMQEPEAVESRPTSEASKHLLICLDASPSMYVEDAGPNRDQKRAVWAGKVVHGILSRIDTEKTRVTVFAIYTKALPVVQDTFDLDVVEHLFDGMPFHTAFEPGPTKLASGVDEALAHARTWPKDSATLVVVSDGDSDGAAVPRFVPPSIADAIVIGVGDPSRPTLVAGHRSKQDAASLRQLASALGGLFHEGNRRQLPSAVLDSLTMIQPRIGDALGLREIAFVAVAFGGAWIAFLAPLLAWFGRRARSVPVIRAGAHHESRGSRTPQKESA